MQKNVRTWERRNFVLITVAVFYAVRVSETCVFCVVEDVMG